MRAAVLLLASLAAAPAFAQDVPPAPEPVGIRAGVPAPGDGVWMSTERAAWVAAHFQATQHENAQLQAALAAQPSGYTGQALAVTAVVAFVLGAAAVAYLKK